MENGKKNRKEKTMCWEFEVRVGFIMFQLLGSFTYSIHTSVPFSLHSGIYMDCLLEFITLFNTRVLHPSNGNFGSIMSYLCFATFTKWTTFNLNIVYIVKAYFTRGHAIGFSYQNVHEKKIIKIASQSVGLLAAWGLTLVGHATTKSLVMDGGQSTQPSGSLHFLEKEAHPIISVTICLFGLITF